MNTIIQKISFIGSGNVATHLAMAMQHAGIAIAEVYSPQKEHALRFAKVFGCQICEGLLDMNTASDLYLLAVPDGKINEVVEAMPKVRGIVAHTSGHVSISVVSATEKYGVFYPLQTFTRKREVDMDHVPLCIEASDELVFDILTETAAKISKSVHRINSRQRKFLHLAAVTVNNFSNHLYHLAEEFLEERDLDFDLLKPLILETAKKVQDTIPAEAQTGPARRGDEGTIDRNIEMLDGNDDFKIIFRLLSEQIMKKYHE